MVYLTKKGVALMTELIIKLQTREEIVEAYPVMKQLRTHLDEESYLELVCEAQEADLYQLLIKK